MLGMAQLDFSATYESQKVPSRYGGHLRVKGTRLVGSPTSPIIIPAPILSHIFLVRQGFNAINVSKNPNDFMKTLFGPKSNVIIVRISALL